MKQLERDRDDLQTQLAAANRRLGNGNNKTAATRLAELESQVATLRARLAVYEARQVPYTAEELALFRAPVPKLAEANPGKKSMGELPPGTVALAAEAHRYYSQKQYDKAEQRYLEVLLHDNKNVATLADLALIQLQLGHLAEAEKNISQALALEPEYAYGLCVLGQVRFGQKRYDDALDALSHSARLDPGSAEVQNMLGLTLSEKGLRGAAEAALRKAIQLEPGYGHAHLNLAVIYLNQQPPSVELARWHYQKALAAGVAHNPDLERKLEAKTATAGGP
jgi:tetratricopeptide (TPR) repeat protein